MDQQGVVVPGTPVSPGPTSAPIELQARARTLIVVLMFWTLLIHFNLGGFLALAFFLACSRAVTYGDRVMIKVLRWGNVLHAAGAVFALVALLTVAAPFVGCMCSSECVDYAYAAGAPRRDWLNGLVANATGKPGGVDDLLPPPPPPRSGRGGRALALVDAAMPLGGPTGWLAPLIVRAVGDRAHAPEGELEGDGDGGAASSDGYEPAEPLPAPAPAPGEEERDDGAVGGAPAPYVDGAVEGDAGAPPPPPRGAVYLFWRPRPVVASRVSFFVPPPPPPPPVEGEEAPAVAPYDEAAATTTTSAAAGEAEAALPSQHVACSFRAHSRVSVFPTLVVSRFERVRAAPRAALALGRRLLSLAAPARPAAAAAGAPPAATATTLVPAPRSARADGGAPSSEADAFAAKYGGGHAASRGYEGDDNDDAAPRRDGEFDPHSPGVQIAVDIAAGLRGNATAARFAHVADAVCARGPPVVLLGCLGALVSLALHCALARVAGKLARHPWVAAQTELRRSWRAAVTAAHAAGAAPPPPPAGLVGHPAGSGPAGGLGLKARVMGAFPPPELLTGVPPAAPQPAPAEQLFRFVPGTGFVAVGAPAAAPAGAAPAGATAVAGATVVAAPPAAPAAPAYYPAPAPAGGVFPSLAGLGLGPLVRGWGDRRAAYAPVPADVELAPLAARPAAGHAVVFAADDAAVARAHAPGSAGAYGGGAI